MTEEKPTKKTDYRGASWNDKVEEREELGC